MQVCYEQGQYRNECRNHLADHGNHMSWNYAELKEKSGLSDKDLCAAIGWLARENKIEFDDESKDQRIYLNFNPYY